MTESKIEKITSIKVAEICLTHAQKEQFYRKLSHVNWVNHDQNDGHLPQYRMRVKDIEVEAAVVHIHLEIPAWNNLISIINSCTNLNPERAVNSCLPIISIKIAKPQRGLASK